VKSSKIARRGEIFFFGEYEHSVDSQRRVAIPKNWREKGESSKFVLLRGHDAIQLIPSETFRDIFEKLKKVSFANKEASRALAQLGSQGQECECDSQGRISISQRLMEYAGINDQVVLVGALSTGQIWAKEKWDRERGSDENLLDIIQKITERPDDLAEILKGKI